MKKGQPKKAITKKISPANKKVEKKNYFNLFGLIIIIILGIIIYSNSFNCSFHFDDFHNIVENQKIQNLSDVKAWWNFVPSRPLGSLSFALNYHFNKLDVWYWHFVNLAIHLINSCLVWWLILLIFSSKSIKDQKLAIHKHYIALFAALLFVSHPLATQSVTYIVQRLASLAAMFYLFSLILYIKARLSDKGHVFKYLLFGSCIISGILAMLTKENAYTLPFTIVLVEFFFFHKKKIIINFRDYRLYLFITGLMGIIILILLKFSLNIFDSIPPQQGHAYTVTSFNYLLTQFSVIIKYIQLLFLPINQMLDYDFPISNSFFELGTLISFILLLSLFILAIFLYKNYRIISFGIFWFFLTLSVEASFIPIPNLIFEHRTYLPSFGFFLILSSVVFTLIGEKHKFLSIVLLVIIIGVNSYLTYERNKVWKDEFSLCNDNVKKAPNSARAASSLGDVYTERGQYDNAIADYSRAIEVNPYYAEAYSNRGAAYLITQQWGNAIADLSKAISINPDLIIAYTNRGITYGKINRWDKALVDFSRVIVINPNISKAYYNRGNTYSQLGLWDKAIADYSKMIHMGTMDERVYAYRGIAFSQLKQWDKAIADYSKALEINPNFELANSKREIALKNLNSSKH